MKWDIVSGNESLDIFMKDKKGRKGLVHEVAKSNMLETAKYTEGIMIEVWLKRKLWNYSIISDPKIWHWQSQQRKQTSCTVGTSKKWLRAFREVWRHISTTFLSIYERDAMRIHFQLLR